MLRAVRRAPARADERKIRSQATIVRANAVSPMNTPMDTWKAMDAAAVHGRSLATRIPVGKYTRNKVVL